MFAEAWGAVSARAEAAFGALLPKLAHSNPLIRRAACETAAKLSPEAFAPLLPAVARLLEDEDGSVRAAAIDALGKVLAPDADSVAARLVPAYVALSDLGAAALSEKGLQPHAFAPELVSAIKLLADEAISTPGMRLAAVQVIGHLEPTALAQHAELLCAIAAGHLELTALAQHEAALHKAVLESIGRLPTAVLGRYVGRLVSIFEEAPDASVRCACVKAVGKAPQAAIVPAARTLVATGLGDAEKNVRAAAKHALRQLRPEQLRLVAEELGQLLLRSASSDVRLAALEVIDLLAPSTLAEPKCREVG